MRGRTIKLIAASLMITLSLVIGKFFVLPVFAATAINVPHYLTFEGQLTNSAGTYQTGTFSMVFTIYDALTGGTALWTETQPTVSVASGYFTAQLGSVTALSLDFSKQYWVTVNVASDGEMTPRIPLNSVGYSYASDVAYSSYVTSTAPTAAAGKLYYDSTDGNLYVYDGVGSAWRDLTAGVGGAGLTSNNTFSGLNTFSATTTMATSTMISLLVSTTSTLQGTLNIGAVLQGGTPLVFEGATANDFETSFVITDPTADRTITFPDVDGMVLLSTTTTLPNLQVLLGLTNVTSTGITATNSNLGTVRAGLWNGTAVGADYGGTGLTSYAPGDLIYASAAATLAKLVTSTPGSVLIVNFSTGLPAYVTTSTLKIALSDTTGTLAVNRGGTNLTSYTKNELLYASDTGVVGQIATSSLGLLTTNVAEGTNKYWTDDRFDTRLSTTTTLPNLQILLGLTNVTSTGITATNSNLGTVRAGLWNGTQIGPTYGGTGLTSYVIGDLLYASAANTLAALPTSTVGSVLQLSFTTGLPAYVTTSTLKIALSDTTGTLAVNRGGTNLTSYTANQLLYASGAGTVGQIATSSLGLLTTNVAEGTGLYWTTDRFDTRLSTTTTLPNLQVLLGLTNVTSTGVTATNFWTTNLAYLNGGLIAGGTSSTISGLSVTSTGNLVSLLAPTYLRIGDAGVTSQSLSANDDLFVSGKLEVDGATYLDDSLTIAKATDFNLGKFYVGTNGSVSSSSTLSTVNGLIFPEGKAVTAGNYSIGRNADTINKMQFEVPTGAGYEWSINDVAQLTLSSAGTLVATASVRSNSGNVEIGVTTLFGVASQKGMWVDAGALNLTGQPTDVATAIGVRMGSVIALTTAGAKLVSGMNATVEKFYIDYTGGAYFGGTSSTISGLAVTSTSNTIDLINTGGSKYIRIGDVGFTSQSLAANDDLLVSGKLEVDGLSYFDAGFIAGGTSSTISGLSVTSTGNLVSLLAPTYLRIGDAGVTSRSLSANDDLFVSGILEVDGAVHFDNAVTTYSTFSMGAGQVRSNTYLSIGTLVTGNSGLYDGVSTGQLNFWLGIDQGRQLVFGSYDARSLDFNHAAQPDPTLFIHSNTLPATDDQEFIGISVSSTLNQAIIQTGSSIDIGFSPAASSTVVMLLSTAGKLGIGTTVPSSTLHIVTSTEQLRLGNDTNTQYLSLTHNGIEGVYDTGNNSGLRLSMFDTATSAATVASSTYIRFEASGWNTSGGGSLNNVSTTIQLVPISAAVTGANISSYLSFTETGTQYARFGKSGGNVTAPYIAGEAADGSTAIGVVLGSVNNFTANTTAKLVSFKNNIGAGATATELGYINASGTAWMAGGFVVGTDTSLYWIDDSSHGTASSTLYLGNAVIATIVSDARLKENVELSKLNALDLLKKFQVKDFDWKEGSSRWRYSGRATGLIAQEVYEYLPQVVDKPANPEDTWAIEYQNMVPYVIKAVQEQQAEIQALSLNNLQGNPNGNVNQDALTVVDMNFQGKLKVKGQVAFGQDTVGQIKILAGATEAQVNFNVPYEYQPIVTLTLASDAYLTKYYVSSASSTGFIVKIEPQQTEKYVLFNWHAFGSETPTPIVEPVAPVVVETITPPVELPAVSEPEQPVPAPAPVVETQQTPIVDAQLPVVEPIAPPPEAPPQPVIETPPAEPPAPQT